MKTLTFFAVCALLIGSSVAESLGWLQEECDYNNATSEQFEAAQNGFKEFGRCTIRVMNSTEMQAFRRYKLEGNALKNVTDRYCSPPYTELLHCMNEMEPLYRPCLNVTDKDDMKKMITTVGAMIAFSCYRDGERIRKFILNDGHKCIAKNKDIIQTCFEPLRSLSLKAMCNLSTHDTKACIMDAINTCPQPDLKVLFSEFLDISHEAFCGNFTPTSSPISPNTNSLDETADGIGVHLE